MSRLAQLWDIVEREKIKVYPEKLQDNERNLLGLYINHSEAGGIILIEKSLEASHPSQYISVLAEEVGHHITGVRQNILQVHKIYKQYGICRQTIMAEQDERSAQRWASDFLIQDIELCQAINDGCRSCYELAEYFYVAEWIVYWKLGFLKVCLRRQGLKVKGKDLLRMGLNNICAEEMLSYRASFK